jgi:hypothetical protein
VTVRRVPISGRKGYCRRFPAIPGCFIRVGRFGDARRRRAAFHVLLCRKRLRKRLRGLYQQFSGCQFIF